MAALWEVASTCKRLEARFPRGARVRPGTFVLRARSLFRVLHLEPWLDNAAFLLRDVAVAQQSKLQARVATSNCALFSAARANSVKSAFEDLPFCEAEDRRVSVTDA